MGQKSRLAAWSIILTIFRLQHCTNSASVEIDQTGMIYDTNPADSIPCASVVRLATPFSFLY